MFNINDDEVINDNNDNEITFKDNVNDNNDNDNDDNKITFKIIKSEDKILRA